ncbi:DNA-directed RNA polymerase IV subunit 1 isoform X3 [Aristolochia californica]|uniref:DNA-directed RNA polymerase IV subunit 1 isoform X3 n=1 Tax=Aristolochia californica TaxID=171875 RepID=UPI0035D5BE86
MRFGGLITVKIFGLKMDNGRITEQQVPSGNIAGLKLELLTAGSIDLFSNIVITENSDLTGPKLGVPNELSSHCYTCGASDTKHCDGHYGYIELPANICHPYNVPKIVQLLNKLCPGCGSVKLSKKTKDVGLSPLLKQRKYRNMGCKYCSGKSIERYPQLKYKYRKRTLEIFAIVNEEKFRSKYDCEKLPDDYWDFVPKVQQPQSASSFEMTFSPYQVYCLIKDLHPDLLSKFSLTKELMFIRRFPVTANCSRVMEKMEDGSQAWHFDDLTKAYKRLVDIKRRVDVFGPRSVQSLCVGQGSSIPTEVGNRLWDCIKVSKLFNRSSSSTKTDSQGSGLSFSEQEFCDVELGPWVGHFHICQEMMKKRRLSIQGVVDALIRVYKSSRRKTRSLPSLQICSGECSFIDSSKGDPRLVCISAAVEISEFNDNLGTLRDEVLPNLLRTTIKGFLDFKKVEILWEDHCKASRLVNNSMGELLIKVHRSESCNQTKFWSSLLDACIPIKDLINWEKSHPDNLCDIFSAFGVDAAWKHFFRTMKSTISDIGRNICQDHLLLIADCLSVTGEFHGLNAKGIEKQMDQMAISSPFMQACFSNPSKQFIKSAKKGAKDDLLGALDAAAWGKEAPLGSGGPFEILYSGKGQNLVNPFEVYDKLLLSHSASCKNIPLNCGDKILGPEDNYSFEEAAECLELDEDFSLVDMSSPVDVVGMLSKFREMLHKYPVNVHLNKTDRSLLMKALSYHPQGNAKLGAGVKAIKVGRHPLHPSKCFMIVRKDGTEEDFSYLKCVMGAAKQISPDLENAFRKELYKGKSR